MNNGCSRELHEALRDQAAGRTLIFRRGPDCYDPGDVLEYEVTGIQPCTKAQARLEVDKFLGGGFAGQVYLCTLSGLSGGTIPGLVDGKRYAVKIMQPPDGAATLFRNFIYWLAFQGPFSAQVSEAASRSGLLWQKLFRKAGELKFRRSTSVKDVYASFCDENLRAYGEITEWVEGRTWRLESDPHIRKRRHWETIDLEKTASAEYIAKRRFMRDMVELMHDMGAPEFARQYEWSTMKSQPNVLKRTDVDESGPGGGLCAIDFRAGLALLPFLPMSPGDFRLILQGLFRRKTLVQFDRCNLRKLDEFVARHAGHFKDDAAMIEELKACDRKYRRSLPDITHHGWRLLFDRELRREVRRGLICGYRMNRLTDEDFAGKLEKSAGLFAVYYFLGAFPVLGRILRQIAGNSLYRQHLKHAAGSWAYMQEALSARCARGLVLWLRKGRVNEGHARRLAKHPGLFLMERWTLGLLPAGLHRAVSEPLYAFRRLKSFLLFLKNFISNAAYREKWFLDQIEDGRRQGMLTDDEYTEIRNHVQDPFIVKYLKCLGVHFATLPVTQIVSVAVGGIVAFKMLTAGQSRADASLAFAAVVALFQVLPISPGSICRGLFVLYLMLRERNFRDYMVAMPLSFVKYIGYLAFPLQMTATYPKLARFMAGRWATSAVHIIPVFGEQGALLEHWVYDLFFNVPQAFGIWARPRVRMLLNIWMALGLALGVWLITHCNWPLNEGPAVNTIIATLCIFVLPRVLFYPLFNRQKGLRSPQALAHPPNGN